MVAPDRQNVSASAPITAQQALLIGRATNLEKIGVLVGTLGGLATAWSFGFSDIGILLGGAVLVGCELVVHAVVWRMTRPLALLAMGDNPRFDRVWRTARLHLENVAIIGGALLLLAKIDIPTWAIVTGMLTAVFGGLLLEFLLRRHLRRCNERDAAEIEFTMRGAA